MNTKKTIALALAIISITGLASCKKKTNLSTVSISASTSSNTANNSDVVPSSTQELENRELIDNSIKDKGFATELPDKWTLTSGTLSSYSNGIVTLPKYKSTDTEPVGFTYIHSNMIIAKKVYISLYAYTNTIDETRFATVHASVKIGDVMIDSNIKNTISKNDAEGLLITEKQPEAYIELELDTSNQGEFNTFNIEFMPTATKTPIGFFQIEIVR